jgi:hypothetical protein
MHYLLANVRPGVRFPSSNHAPCLVPPGPLAGVPARRLRVEGLVAGRRWLLHPLLRPARRVQLPCPARGQERAHRIQLVLANCPARGRGGIRAAGAGRATPLVHLARSAASKLTILLPRSCCWRREGDDRGEPATVKGGHGGAGGRGWRPGRSRAAGGVAGTGAPGRGKQHRDGQRLPASASVERDAAAAAGRRDRPWRTSLPGLQTEHPIYLTGAGPVPCRAALWGPPQATGRQAVRRRRWGASRCGW